MCYLPGADNTHLSGDMDNQDESRSANKMLGFNIFKTPDMLCRHPAPYTGRDDDIQRLEVVLEDILVKTGKHPGFSNDDGSRILFAPDHKISSNVFILAKKNNMFKKYLLEFPLLHLRKSKITNLLAAYKDACLG